MMTACRQLNEEPKVQGSRDMCPRNLQDEGCQSFHMPVRDRSKSRFHIKIEVIVSIPMQHLCALGKVGPLVASGVLQKTKLHIESNTKLTSTQGSNNFFVEAKRAQALHITPGGGSAVGAAKPPICFPCGPGSRGVRFSDGEMWSIVHGQNVRIQLRSSKWLCGRRIGK